MAAIGEGLTPSDFREPGLLSEPGSLLEPGLSR